MLQQRHVMAITTKGRGWLMKCPKRVLQNHAQNPLILQAQNRTHGLTKKVRFSGRLLLCVTGCVKMYENCWFENAGSQKAAQASPASPIIDADDTQSRAAYGSIWPLMRKLLPSMTTVSAWCSRRSRMAAVKVLSLLNILGHSL